MTEKAPSSRVWLIVLIALTLTAFLAPVLPLPDPLETAPRDQFHPPSIEHIFGTDQFGRDVLSRAIWGARYSLFGAFLATLIAIGIGLLMGGIAGAFGGWLDWGIMRLVDVLLAFPGLLLAMVLIAILNAGLLQVAIVVGIALAPIYSRLARAAVLSVRLQLYVEAARVLGAGRWRIIIRHLIPNAAGQLLTFTAVIYTWALLDMAALDFLGLSGSPSLPTWGRMLNEGRSYLRVAPWIAFVPGIFLLISVLSVTGLSDAWRMKLLGSIR